MTVQRYLKLLARSLELSNSSINSSNIIILGWCVLVFFFGVSSGVIWRRQWQPTPVLLPGKSHGRRSLVGCSPWGC